MQMASAWNTRVVLRLPLADYDHLGMVAQERWKGIIIIATTRPKNIVWCGSSKSVKAIKNTGLAFCCLIP